MKKISIALLILLVNLIRAQDLAITLKTESGNIEGSLLFPHSDKKLPLVLLIAGSGPTDRNGNNDAMENNSLKYLAEELYKNNIASLRFDKRSVGTSVTTDEIDLRFDTYVNDVREWIKLLSNDSRFSKIIVAGHSEGSLLGMIASQNNAAVKGFVSIAGSGRGADELFKEQLRNVHESAKSTLYSMIDDVKKGDTIVDVPMLFYTLFRPSIQKYMISWFKYDPAQEIKKIQIPILILQGDKDIQVKLQDAEILATANPESQMVIIKNMNHVLKNCDTLDKDAQKLMYSDLSLPIKPELVESMVQFIKK